MIVIDVRGPALPPHDHHGATLGRGEGRGLRESSHSTKERDARRLLKVREGDIEHGLPVDPKLNRIRFEEAAEDLKRSTRSTAVAQPTSSSGGFACT